MPTYIPISYNKTINAENGELYACFKRGPKVSLEMRYARERSNMRVNFSQAVALKILNRIGVEDDDSEDPIGLVAQHVAYQVQGSTFFDFYAPFLRRFDIAATHYRFITPNSSIDVIASDEPSFKFLTEIK